MPVPIASFEVAFSLVSLMAGLIRNQLTATSTIQSTIYSASHVCDIL